MSWIEKIENATYTIITGDGKVYYPKWKDAQVNMNFNTVGYNYFGIDGTYVDRGNLQGKQYPLNIYFDGENYIETANEFRNSCADKRPWIVKHPIYNNITCQPITLNFEDNTRNCVTVTGIIWETLISKYPKFEVSQQKDIEYMKSDIDFTLNGNFSEYAGIPSNTLIEPNKLTLNSIAAKYQNITTDSDAINTLKNLLRSADNAATNLTSAPTTFIQDTIALINFPFIIEANIESKVNVFLENLDTLADLLLPEEGGYLYYESQAITTLSQLCINLVNADEEDYVTRNNIINIISSITVKYDNYKTNLDEYGETPNYDLNYKLDNIINRTFGYLFQLAFDSKKEISVILSEDNNLVNLAHKYYGPGDDNLELFINQNNIMLKEYLNLKKGRKITYYV